MKRQKKLNGLETLSDPDHADVVAMPPLIYFISIVTAMTMKWFVGGVIAPANTLRVTAGALLLIAGILVILWFSRVFKKSGQDPRPNTPTPQIVTDGPYRYSRNPAYVCLTAIQIGLALLLDNIWILLLLAPVLWVMHYGVILREEIYLERKFGSPYLRYKQQVRRWL